MELGSAGHELFTTCPVPGLLTGTRDLSGGLLCAPVRVPWWSEVTWEVGTVTCMPGGIGLGVGSRKKQPFLVCSTKLCKGKVHFY